MAQRKIKTVNEKRKEKWGMPMNAVRKAKVFSQAEWIIHKFGGARELMRKLEAIGVTKDPAAIFKWTYPRERGGSDGIIPTSAQIAIAKCARRAGILLEATDWIIVPQKREYYELPRHKAPRKSRKKKKATKKL